MYECMVMLITAQSFQFSLHFSVVACDLLHIYGDNLDNDNMFLLGLFVGVSVCQQITHIVIDSFATYLKWVYPAGD